MAVNPDKVLSMAQVQELDVLIDLRLRQRGLALNDNIRTIIKEMVDKALDERGIK